MRNLFIIGAEFADQLNLFVWSEAAGFYNKTKVRHFSAKLQVALLLWLHVAMALRKNNASWDDIGCICVGTYALKKKHTVRTMYHEIVLYVLSIIPFIWCQSL